MRNIELEILETNILIIFAHTTNIVKIIQNKSGLSCAKLRRQRQGFKRADQTLYLSQNGFLTWTVEFTVPSNIDRFLVALCPYFEFLNFRILQHIG